MVLEGRRRGECRACDDERAFVEGLFVFRDGKEEVRVTMDGDGYVQVIFDIFFL